MAQIADIRPGAADEVVVTLTDANADLPYLLSSRLLAIGPTARISRDGIGTGPFALESFEPGVTTRVKRNPNDWASDRGYVDSVETIAINDPGARIAALLSGSVHLANKLAPTAVSSLEKSARGRGLQTSPAGITVSSAPCATQPPLDNNDLMLALKFAIDRDAIVKTVQRGYGKIGNDHPIPSYDR